MKNIIILISTLCLITTLVSCDEEALLDVDNRNELSAQNFWQTQRNAESGIYSAYSALQFTGAGGSGATVAYALSSEAGKVGNIAFLPQNLQFNNALVDQSNSILQSIWEDCYRIAFRANAVLDNVPGIDMDPTAKRTILGEAYFLRGLAMFWIATSFNNGSVPYPLVAANTLETARIGIQPREVVYEQIINDLILAQNNLEGRLSWSAENQEGRATWGAATSILGKVYLYEKQYNNAKIEFKKIIDSGVYELVEDIADNFSEEGEFNTESIFEIQFFANVPDQANFGGGEGDQPNESTLRQTVWQRQGGGFGQVFATHFIASLYRNEVVDRNIDNEVRFYDASTFDRTDGVLFDIDNFELRERKLSRRAEASIAYENDGSLYYTAPTFSTTGNVNFTRVRARTQVRKFSNWELGSENRASGINERVIRLADVYLMYAEAVLEDEGNAGIPIALEFINKVRQRSGLVTLETLFQGVDVPPIITNTTYVSSDFVGGLRNSPGIGLINNVDFTGSAEDVTLLPSGIEKIKAQLDPEFLIPQQDLTAENIVLHLFNKERPAEFAWEGRDITWQDLKRRPGGLASRIQNLGDIDYLITSRFVNLGFAETNDLELEFTDFVQRKINVGQEDNSFPIPADEVIQNPLLNSGN